MKQKTFGPAKSTDAKELLLAKLIQNAHAYNMKFAERAAYLKKGEPCGGIDTGPDGADSCCAMGAAWLETDTHKDVYHSVRMARGNDFPEEPWVIYSGGTDMEDVGHAYRMAMTVDE